MLRAATTAVVQRRGQFLVSRLFLLTLPIRAGLPGYDMSASKGASAAGTSPTYSGGASV